MKKLMILGAASLLALNSCIIVVKPAPRACNVPINSTGYNTSVKFERAANTVIDRGQVDQSVYSSYRYYQEQFGRTLYLYDGDQLKARVINPANVEVN